MEQLVFLFIANDNAPKKTVPEEDLTHPHPVPQHPPKYLENVDPGDEDGQ